MHGSIKSIYLKDLFLSEGFCTTNLSSTYLLHILRSSVDYLLCLLSWSQCPELQSQPVWCDISGQLYVCELSTCLLGIIYICGLYVNSKFYNTFTHAIIYIYILYIRDTLGIQVFSQVFQVNWCHLGIRSIWPTYNLQGLTVSMNHPMEPACVRYIPGPPEKQILPKVVQNDLFGALKAKLGLVDLIRNISPMWWNMEVQPTPNYFLGWPYKSISN